jgi:HAD superfamily hydrolase (TIGR01509 family)
LWVIFDNDGVLVDSERLANEILAELLGGYGWPLTAAQSVERFLGGTLQRVRETAEAHLGRPLGNDFEDVYHRMLFDRFQADLHPVPGVVSVVRAVAPECSVASSGSRERVRRSLALTGLASYFADRIVSADDVAYGKPAPDLFLLAARQQQLAPADCVVIEDSPAGVSAARAAGMTCFGYAGLTPAGLLADADVVFASMDELPALLGL